MYVPHSLFGTVFHIRNDTLIVCVVIIIADDVGDDDIDADIAADAVTIYSGTLSTSYLVVRKQHSLQSVRRQQVVELLLASSTSFLVSCFYIS